MAKLYFYYSAMNAGKSTALLQSDHNYRSRGLRTLRLTPEIDTRYGEGRIASRIGLSAEAEPFDYRDNLFERCRREKEQGGLHCVFVDEAQFLVEEQVRQLGDVADYLDVPVVTFGLRTDFQGKLFEGSRQLLAWADKIAEIKTICHCGRKATMVLRLDARGQVVRAGSQIEVGGEDRYLSVCRLHFKEGLARRDAEEGLFPSGDRDS
jgi:thymidine kinase